MSVAAFELTPANEASAPPAERDEVRLLVAQRGRPLVHDMFRGLPAHLRAGDLLVVNTSATMPAALSAGDVDVHLSTPLPGDHEGFLRGPPPKAAPRWVVELRRCGARYRGGRAGDLLPLPGGGVGRAPRPVPLAGPAVDRRARPPAAAGRLPRRARPADRLRAPRRAAPARGPPDGLRRRARQRGDAERRPAVLPARARRPLRARRAGRAARAPHRRLEPRARRAAVPRALPRPRPHRQPRQRPPRRRRPRDRGRHHRRARAGDRRRARAARSLPARAGRAWS